MNTYFVKHFYMWGSRHNRILMSLLLLVAETITGLPQKKICENPGLQGLFRTLCLIFQDIIFIDSRTFPVFFKKY